MKIGIFSDAYYPQISGVVTSVVTLREELIKLGHEVSIVTVSTPDAKTLENENGIIRVPSIPFAKWKELRIGLPLLHIGLKSEIESLNLDIIHTQTEFTVGLVGANMARSLKIPLIHTYHTMYVDYTHYIYSLHLGQSLVKGAVKNLSKSFINRTNTVIAPTKKTRDALLSYGVKIPIQILPTGIDIKHFEKMAKNSPEIVELRNKYGIAERDRVLLFLGRVSAEKSVDFLINAFPKILKREPNAKLLIVGDGPEKKDIEKQVEDLGLTDRIVFTGLVKFSEVPKYYSLAEVFVNASKTETQGLTIMEAMASGMPIVVFNDGNIAEHIRHDVSGRLFNTEEEFVEYVISALNDSEKNETLISNALGVVHSLSKENFALRMQDIYRGVINDVSYVKKLRQKL